MTWILSLERNFIIDAFFHFCKSFKKFFDFLIFYSLLFTSFWWVWELKWHFLSVVIISRAVNTLILWSVLCCNFFSKMMMWTLRIFIVQLFIFAKLIKKAGQFLLVRTSGFQIFFTVQLQKVAKNHAFFWYQFLRQNQNQTLDFL